MKLIIDIPEEDFERCKKRFQRRIDIMGDAIAKGTPVLDNVTNERMVGSWIKSRDSYGNNHFTCPFCEHDIATKYADTWEDNYCSNCGAKMKSEVQDADSN